jgi:D-alanine-D-alanine ligase
VNTRSIPGHLRVAVLMGGPSREHEVSLASGRAVCEALADRGHVVVPVELTDAGLAGVSAMRPDVAFIALHGRYGEDGGVQRDCEAIGLPYTGSGPEASARAFDKALARRLFSLAGLQVPAGLVLQAPLEPKWIRAAMAELGPKVVIKPSCEGSSIGVHIVAGADGLAEAVEDVNRIGGAVLVERYVPGRELTVAVLGTRALPPVETIPGRAFYDFQAKYDPGSGTRYQVAPPLAADVHHAVTETALTAHAALDCASFSRVDMRLPEGGAPVVLEVNTIPGLTATSLLPKAAAAAGLDFGDLCERMLVDALSRARGVFTGRRDAPGGRPAAMRQSQTRRAPSAPSTPEEQVT